MVKLKSNLGPMQGRIGGIRVYEVNGETIGVSIPQKIKNPKSVAQMKQRIKINNILAIYRFIKPFLQNNFEGIRGNKNAASFFRSYNLMLNPLWLQEREKLFDYCVLAPYVVSQGRIPSVSYEFKDDCFCTDINIADDDLNDDMMIQMLTATIKAFNEGWATGDSLKILLVRQQKMTETDQHLHYPECASIAIELTNSKNSIKSIPMLDVPEGFGRLSLCNKDGKLAVRVSDTEHYTYGFAVVHTKGEGMDVKASSQTLCLSDNALYDYYCSDEAMTLALKSYKTDM